ncbi:hemolysin III family protein [Flavobacterium sp. NRK F10]|uniref:Hemolysin III family protein n=1 Tax=Flavobacterium sediminis TaxID=2201181 RepID=A0A2U8QS38_9FLAO|nr:MULTISPECIES: hemolysin III family protein [Flavobacterium]AWM12973.1 hemolysin III family protein [Flavobacterium sediminis]MCO6174120.1 hemolysin III family protein [Flavobacterium sp. NRK F10]
MLKIKDKEEFLNTVSHAAGIVLGVVGLVFLLLKNRGLSSFSTLSIWIYGFCVIALYTASTVYHAISHEVKKRKARIFDHIGIFLLIAGTYTPICLVTLEQTSGWTLFFIIWSIATAGLIMKLFLTGKVEKLSLIVYLVMGWLVVAQVKELIHLLSVEALVFMAVGGAFYTLGTIFYASKRIPYGHFIWHLFVLGGSISHYFMIYTIV